MLPKHVYMSLPPSERKKVKASVTGQGSYRRNFVRGSGSYRRNFVRGKGSYNQNFVRNVKGRGAFGAALGGAMVQPLAKGLAQGIIGGTIAPIASRLGRWITGKGDYQQSVPGTLAPPSVPLMAKNTRSNVFTYREYLGDVYSSVDFAATVFNINPGLGDPGSPVPGTAGLFPWLSNTAQQYEQYRVEQMIIEFISTSSDAVVSGATTSSLGQVCISTQYNCNSPAFTNLTDALNSQYATTEKPSTNFCHPIECYSREKAQNVQFIRSTAIASGQDILQYDMGQVNLITQGMPADGEVIGQLWVSYKVSLFKPILVGAGSSAASQWAHYTYNNSGSDVSSGNYWGSTAGNMQPKSSTNLGITFTYGSAQWKFTDTNTTGLFQCTLMIRGASTANVSQPTPAVAAGGSLYNILGNNVQSFPVTATGTAINVSCTFFVKVTDGNTFVGNFTGATLPTSITWVDFVVTRVNDYANLSAERKFGNFWRPIRGAPTAPWLRGKLTHDRSADAKQHHPQKLTKYEFMDMMYRAMGGQFAEEDEKGDEKSPESTLAGVEEEISEAELDLIRRLRKDKASIKTLDTEYVKVEQSTPKPSKSQSLKA